MTKHPRASELPKLVAALEKSGRPVAAVEVRWSIDEDGKETPVWKILFGADAPRPETKVDWS